MKPSASLISRIGRWLVVLGSLGSLGVHAQYHAYNIASGSDAILQDYRSPNAPPGIYDAIHETTVTSSDGGSGYFYGGMTHRNGVNGTLIQYVCWPAAGGFAPYSQQIPVFAGSNMVGYPQIGEGSSCAIKGYWPQFSTNLWYRFAVRFWQPAEGPPHLGYQGMWMKDPVTGAWHHLGTFLYPFAVTGVNTMTGWQENYSGYTGTYVVDHTGGYYHKSGAWKRANQIRFTAKGWCSLIDDATAARSVVGDASLGNNVPITLTLTGQPAAPEFDPILVTNAAAKVHGHQLLVHWEIPPTSSPPLSYTIEVFTNAAATGLPALTFTRHEPETRQQLLSLPDLQPLAIRLSIADIFFRTNLPVVLAPEATSPVPSESSADRVPGLNYVYYEAKSGSWTNFDWGAPQPVRRGVVGFPDPSPRLRRVNYAFEYSGLLDIPETGLYAFKLRSGDGSHLMIDGQTIIVFNGLHDSTQFVEGSATLAAGHHRIELYFFKGPANPVNPKAYNEGLGLTWEGPNLPESPIPTSAFWRLPLSNEPSVAIQLAQGAVVDGASPAFTASVDANGQTVNAVQFLLTGFESYYPRPNPTFDVILGQDSQAPYTFNQMIWTAPSNQVRARMIVNGNYTLDSPLISFTGLPPTWAPWTWSSLEMHNYPSAAVARDGRFQLLGDGMNMVSRRVTGDCTLTARLAALTPDEVNPEGVRPEQDWRAGIILRGGTNTTLGEPLGNGSTRFAALFGTVGGETHFQDDTMRAGNGDANRWSSNLGGGNRWFRLQRRGTNLVSFVSPDGQLWTQVNAVGIAGLPATLYAGVFSHAVQSFNPNLHRATLDSLSLTGSNVSGSPEITISPPSQQVIEGRSASFTASVIGPTPTHYQWRLNDIELPGATNAIYTITSVASRHAGIYTVKVDDVISASADLTLTRPEGSATWIKPSGGSWGDIVNWSEQWPAVGIDAVADFAGLPLDANTLVTLDGNRTVGVLLFDDRNAASPHSWVLNPGRTGTLTLATASDAPAIISSNPTNIIAAVVSGTQGFTKSGPGTLILTGAGTFTGLVDVREGVLEVRAKNGDTPYAIAPDATLRLGYSFGGGYANTAISIHGGGIEAGGLQLLGGKNFNASGQITLLGAPTTIRQYGSGFANLGTFDINGDGLWCSAAASGSILDTNVRLVSQGYGMSVKVDVGANTASGDLTINGPLQVANLGLFKRGDGSLRLNRAAENNLAVQLQAGTLIAGASQCLGTNASLVTAARTVLDLGSLITTQTVKSATLAGTLNLAIRHQGTAESSLLGCRAGPLACGGTLVIRQLPGALSGGESFNLLSAPSYSGSFAKIQLPPLTSGLSWDTSKLLIDGTIRVQGSVQPAKVSWLMTPNALRVSWPTEHLGSLLQAQTNPLTTGLSATWWDLPGTDRVTATNLPIDAANPSVFYRLRQGPL
ncbi:MAG: immunoglobulin domain-containing protein [Verrucomicrobiales bacterium]|nr:immunoglobulin domain-containing protein [Verrucomicrobiales bacterium]